MFRVSCQLRCTLGCPAKQVNFKTKIQLGKKLSIHHTITRRTKEVIKTTKKTLNLTHRRLAVTRLPKVTLILQFPFLPPSHPPLHNSLRSSRSPVKSKQTPAIVDSTTLESAGAVNGACELCGLGWGRDARKRSKRRRRRWVDGSKE